MAAGEVNLLLGADTYSAILKRGVREGASGTPVAQQTSLGWILTGGAGAFHSTSTDHTGVSMTTQIQNDEDTNTLLKQFWELEEITKSPEPRGSVEDDICEKLFVEGCRRLEDGRYQVRLPIKPNMSQQLGNTFKSAERQLQRLQTYIIHDSVLKREYTEFMKDYESEGHMKRLPNPNNVNTPGPTFYLPHHHVWQRADGCNRLRVVFNASARSSSGASLNDILYTGPSLQRDLDAIILRSRFHPILLCTDIKQMYRQIRIDQRDVDLQRIIWKNEVGEPILHYQLLTVTYGISCAPYLAMRTLRQLIKDEGARFPMAAKSLALYTFVDDIVTGAEDERAAIHLKDELIRLLKSGGFQLRKWVSNCPSVLAELPVDHRLRPTWKDFKDEGLVKTLGIFWDPTEDEFRFTSPVMTLSQSVTKRQVLSFIARLFDPIRWLSPLTIIAKILMQDLWRRLKWRPS